MAEAENSIIINKPIDKVFQFLLDGMNNKFWRPDVIKVDRANDKPLGLGSSFNQTMKGPMGREITGNYDITECVVNQKITFLVTSGPARPMGSFLLNSVDGGTKVSFKLSFKPKGFARLMNSMIQKTMKGEVAKLTNLKSYLESS